MAIKLEGYKDEDGRHKGHPTSCVGILGSVKKSTVRVRVRV